MAGQSRPVTLRQWRGNAILFLPACQPRRSLRWCYLGMTAWHPVCCAAAVGNIKAIGEGKLVETCEEKGVLLESLLSHSSIVEVRRIGMMFAVEFESSELVYKIVDKCLEKGVIAFYFLSCPESFRLAPPLTISEEELRIAAKAINEAIEESVAQ